MANPPIAADEPNDAEYIVDITERPVGVRLVHEDKIIVDQVLETGFGAKLGIKKGDALIEINGTSIVDFENDKAIQLFQDTELPFKAKFCKAIQDKMKESENDDHDDDDTKNTDDNIQNLPEWNVVDVLKWLIDYGRDELQNESQFVDYQQIFWQKRIDGAILKTLNQIDLFNLGINDRNDCYNLYIGIQSKLGVDTKDIKPISDSNPSDDQPVSNNDNDNDDDDDKKDNNDNDDARQHLIEFYKMYNPQKLKDEAHLNEVLRRYKGRESQLFANLDRKYIKTPLFASDDDDEDEILAIFKEDKYDYCDRGRFILIEDCLSFKRICYILCKYTAWIEECSTTQRLAKYKKKEFEDEKLMIDITEYQKGITHIMDAVNYNNVLLLDDFNYIKLNYIDKRDPNCNTNTNFHFMYKCFCNKMFANKSVMSLRDISGSFLLARNYRNRGDFQDDTIMKQWYFGFCDDYNQSINTQQLLDKIYCFFMHSYDVGLILTEKEENIMNVEDDDDDSNWYKSSGLFNIGKIIEAKRKNLCNKLSGLSKRRYKKKNNRFLTNYENQYMETIKYYYWDYHKKNEKQDYRNQGYRYCDWYIDAKYESLKAELMFNNICHITFPQWNQLKLKSEQYQQTEFVKKYLMDITIAHLISVLVYSNFDRIQRKLRQTFFKIPINETNESLKQRHSNFCFLSRYLRETIEKYGERKYFYDKYINSFYHGINTNTPYRVILSTYSFLSFSTNYECIVSFSDNNGLILEVEENEYFFCSPKYINCSIFSDYPAENEYLFIPAELQNVELLQIKNVIDPKLGFNYHLYLESLFIIRQMINDWYFHDIALKEKNKKLVCKLICHELSSYSDSFMSLNVIPTYINTLLHDFFLSITKLNIIWEAWNEEINIKNSHQIGYQFIRKILINSEHTFLNFPIIVLLFPNMKEIKIINDTQYKKSKLFLSTDLLDTIFVTIKNNQNKQKFTETDDGSEKHEFNLKIITIVAPRQLELTIFRAIEIYDKIYSKIGWRIKRGLENDHIIIEKIKKKQ